MLPQNSRFLSKLWIHACLMGALSVSTTAQAGLIPWSYNAIFGYGPVFPNRYYAGAPMSPYGSGGMTYAAGYPGTFSGGVPVTSYYGSSDWGWGGFAQQGFSGQGFSGDGCNPCRPVCNPCGPVCNPCGNGSCADGNCGNACESGYSPSIQNGPTPEPTPADRNPPKTSPPPANPPAPRNEPPLDEFRPAPTGNDNRPISPNSTIPRGPAPDNFGGGNSGFGNPEINNPGMNPPANNVPSSIPPINPNLGTPSSTVPSTIPGMNPAGGNPAGSTIPDPGGLTPPARDPAPADGTTNLFRMPVESNKPESTDILPEPIETPKPTRPEPVPTEPEAHVHPLPMNQNLGVVANIQIRRQRVILDRAEALPTVVRMNVAPRSVTESLPEILARN
ncbi:MAG TPA: hypothetical protein VNQ76_01965 [Planctomicrobium sp.]|nr:hypothetical protein [Planctomicrobium sp.]